MKGFDDSIYIYFKYSNMAEYSKEYSKIQGNDFYDFSYKEMLEEIEDGFYEAQICEGLGTFGIHKKKGVWYLVVSYDGELAEYFSFLKAFKDKDNKNLN